MKYASPTKAGTWHYRRRVPKRLINAVGRTELKKFLGATKREALLAYPRVHAAFEKILAEAERPAPRTAAPSPLAAYHEARGRLQATEAALSRLEPEEAERRRDIEADSILEAYPSDRDTGEPIGVPEGERLYVNALRARGEVNRPPPTLEDARDLYLKDKVEGRSGEKTDSNRVALVMGHVHSAIGKEKLLSSLSRPDARDVRDYMLKERGMNPATARRYLNVIRAIVTHGIREFGLRGATNPFDRLEVKIDAVAKDERKPFTAAQLKATSDRVANFANADLQRIWRILKGTGARLAEVTGLLVSDVSVDGKHPFLDLVFHPHRRLKNKGSIRRVPLIGDALSATREALSAVGNSPFLFKTYSKGSKGANAASNALMKHVRKITDDRKVVVHSLRHNIEDGFTLASVNEYDGTLC